MAPLLTTASQLQCPHGGTVMALPGNVRALAGGQPVLRLSDQAVVQGCPAPHPCQRVQFDGGSVRVLVGGVPAASAAGVAQCVAADGSPQGPAMAVAGQGRALAG